MAENVHFSRKYSFSRKCPRKNKSLRDAKQNGVDFGVMIITVATHEEALA